MASERCPHVATERSTGLPDNRCVLPGGHDGLHEHDIPRIVGCATGPQRNACSHCGGLDWTVEKYGRVTHKQGCPMRRDPWHQANPFDHAPWHQHMPRRASR